MPNQIELEGFQAYTEGKSLHSNPYSFSDDKADWEHGHDHARRCWINQEDAEEEWYED